MWLLDGTASEHEIDVSSCGPPEISALTGEGLDTLAESLRGCLVASRGAGRQWLGMTAARCRESLEAVAEA